MKFKEIPEVLRKWRRALVEKWLRATTLEERRQILERAGPEPSVVSRAIAKFWDASGMIHAKTIEDKEIADLRAQVNALENECQRKRTRGAVLSRQLEDMQAQVNALDLELIQGKERCIALQQRLDQVRADELTAPARAKALVMSLGFDVDSSAEIYKTPTAKNDQT